MGLCCQFQAHPVGQVGWAGAEAKEAGNLALGRRGGWGVREASSLDEGEVKLSNSKTYQPTGANKSAASLWYYHIAESDTLF